jgi:thiamine biosynthesis protein ThiC
VAEPTNIGLKARVTINANIGNSPTTSSLQEEVAKLGVAERWGAESSRCHSNRTTHMCHPAHR